MVRPLRIEYPGAIYHVTSRGNARSDIYKDGQDRSQFLELFGEVCERYHWRCYAYCLMGNHFHIVIETVEGNLSNGMRQMNSVYSQRFNRRHARVGHVFQGRYFAVIVDKEAYLLELMRYVILNPVRACMVKKAEQWRWSSYRALIGKTKCPEWLKKDWVLGQFGLDKYDAQKNFIEFIADGKTNSNIWQKLQKRIYLGGDKFVEQMERYLDKNSDLSEYVKEQRCCDVKPLEYYNLISVDRNHAILLAYNSGGYSQKLIADYFNLHYSSISIILKKSKVSKLQ